MLFTFNTFKHCWFSTFKNSALNLGDNNHWSLSPASLGFTQIATAESYRGSHRRNMFGSISFGQYSGFFANHISQNIAANAVDCRKCWFGTLYVFDGLGTSHRYHFSVRSILLPKRNLNPKNAKLTSLKWVNSLE